MSADFLGRAWVPLTLAIVALAVVGSIAASEDVVGFLLAEMIVAFSVTLRLTWDKHSCSRYLAVLIALVATHVIFITMFYDMFSRAQGGIYMIAALADASTMTVFINTILREK